MSGRKVFRRSVAVLAGGLLLAACGTAAAQGGGTARGGGLAQDDGRTPEAPPVDAPGTAAEGEPVAWHGARLEEPGSRTLVLHFYGGAPQDAPIGPCNPRYTASAERSRGGMTVTVLAHRPPSQDPVSCAEVAYERTVAVRLPAPLRGDTAVDGATGETMPVFDVEALRTPAWLPAGYEFEFEGFPFDPTRNERTWRAGDDSLIVTVTDRDPPAFEPNEHTIVLTETEINGQPAIVHKTRGFDDNVTATWVEGGHTVAVSTLGSPVAPLSVDELLRVARSLR